MYRDLEDALVCWVMAREALADVPQGTSSNPSWQGRQARFREEKAREALYASLLHVVDKLAMKPSVRAAKKDKLQQSAVIIPFVRRNKEICLRTSDCANSVA